MSQYPTSSKVNFKRLLLLLLPTFLRRTALKAYFKAIATALKKCKTDIDNFFNDINYHVQVTPQLFSLEKMLNDKCDPSERRIRIKIPTPGDSFYFTDMSNEVKYFAGGGQSQFFMGKSEYSYDFGVYAPQEIESEDMTNIITALLNKYAIITKTFLIFYV